MRSFTVGRINGVEIKLHPSFALVLLWVVIDWRGLGLADGVGQSVFGLVLVGLVFLCVLLHEMGHALMAHEHGVRVHDVTLSAIGGVARMDHLPAQPRAEVAIALAGPATNVAVAAGLLPIVLLIGILSGFGDPGDYVLEAFAPSLSGLVIGLFYANLLIVFFNLLPAFPMDGGRLLRAALGAALGREAGTRFAVWVGQGLAVVMAIVAIFWLHSLTLPIIALFIAVLAHAEGRVVRVEAAMRRLRVGQFALWDMGGIEPSQPLTYALRGGPRDVAVTVEGAVVGMLWRNRVLSELAGGRSGRTVGEVMDSEVITADVDESVYDVHRRMSQHNRWAIPIIEDGLYRGIFTADRFLHLYRQLAPSLGGRLAPGPGFTAAVQGVVRLFVR